MRQMSTSGITSRRLEEVRVERVKYVVRSRESTRRPAREGVARRRLTAAQRFAVIRQRDPCHPHRKPNVRCLGRAAFQRVSDAPVDDLKSFCKSRRDQDAGKVRVTCTVVSLFWYYRCCLLMPQLTMHSLGIGATVGPETFSYVRATLPRRVTTPATRLIATWAPTVHSYYVTKPNGAKLNTAGITRHRFDQPQTVMADGSLDRPSPQECTATETQHVETAPSRVDAV